ncbi:DUF2388 domain-containing protein [Pseudomonas serboccidentalis]|uniref:DUF2388 domain-containing protein n=1 Tax=Pseudomonas serboccidentalis TaxID=2964670 RepID=A0ABY7Z4S9_9PSED|nr:DUF2388 domain-containing protein [Pseudomonas serboccidentalis]WDR34407.1 DUF2388 domain-containing protein [Pseudomonas serboccidentalis]
MPAFNFTGFKRYTLLSLVCVTSNVYAHCDGLCIGRTDTPWEATQLSGFTLASLLLAPFSASQETTESHKRVYSAEELEDARLYLASDGMLQAAYFTSALQRYRQNSPDSALSDLAVATLISSQ